MAGSPRLRCRAAQHTRSAPAENPGRDHLFVNRSDALRPACSRLAGQTSPSLGAGGWHPGAIALWEFLTTSHEAARAGRSSGGSPKMTALTFASHPLSKTVLVAGIDRLAHLDQDVARALARVGYPAPRQREPGFATLLRIMVAQQLSTRSAAAIWGRLEAACAPAVSAERFLELDQAAFRAIGFSRQKIAHGRALAEAVAGGALDLEALAGIPEEEAIAAISALRGFGRWSGEIYLLFALGRADVFPADDLGLQIGMQRLKRLAARPNRKAMDQLALRWRPLRGCGAIFLWHYYGSAALDEAEPAPAA